MYYVLSGLAGAVVAIFVAVLARSNLYVLAGLAPLFPTFAVFAHLLSHKNGGIEQVRDVALFGMFAVIPYLAYVATLYFGLEKMRFEWALTTGIVFWCITAFILFAVWNRTV